MIKYFNRKTRKYEIEKVAGGTYLKWIYSSPLGMKILEIIIKKKYFLNYMVYSAIQDIAKKGLNLLSRILI